MSEFEIKRYHPYQDGMSSCGTNPLYMLESNTGGYVKVGDLATVIANDIHNRKKDLEFMIDLYKSFHDEPLCESLLEKIKLLKKEIVLWSKMYEVVK